MSKFHNMYAKLNLLSRRSYLSISHHIFSKNYGRLLFIAFLISILFIISAFLLNVESKFFNIVILDVGNTAADLFSILYASIAILLSISASTHWMFSKNTKWYMGLVKIIQKFKIPIISSLILAFLCHVGPLFYSFIHLESNSGLFLTSGLVLLIMSTNIFLIFATAGVSLEMLAYIKAQFIVTADERATPHIEISTSEDYVIEFEHCRIYIHTSLSELISELNKVHSFNVHPEYNIPSDYLRILSIKISSLLSLIEQDSDDLLKSYTNATNGLSESELKHFNKAIQRKIVSLMDTSTQFKNDVDRFKNHVKNLAEFSIIYELCLNYQNCESVLDGYAVSLGNVRTAMSNIVSSITSITVQCKDLIGE